LNFFIDSKKKKKTIDPKELEAISKKKNPTNSIDHEIENTKLLYVSWMDCGELETQINKCCGNLKKKKNL